MSVLWPGDNLLSPLSYSVEEKDAREAAKQLARFYTERLARKDSPNFIAHSLGSLVTLETMKSSG